MKLAAATVLLALPLLASGGCSRCRSATGSPSGTRADRRVQRALVRWSDIEPLCRHKRVVRHRGCGTSPDVMFRYLVMRPIPDGVSEITGFGDCWQGHDLWLRFRAKPAAKHRILARYRPFDYLASVYENKKRMGDCTFVGHHALCEFLAPTIRKDLFPEGRSDLPANVRCYFKKTDSGWGGCTSLVESADGDHLYVRAFAP